MPERPRDSKGRFASYQQLGQTERDPRAQTRPVHSDISRGFSAIVEVAADVLLNPDIALRTNRSLSEQMIRDPMVMGPLQKRMLATAQLDWQVVPQDDTDEQQVEVANQIDTIIKEMPRKQDFFKHLLWADWRGTGAAEVNWHQRRDNFWGVDGHRPHNGDKILYDKFGEPRIQVREHQTAGRPLTPGERDRLIIHTFDPEDGSFYEPREAGYVFKGRGLRDLTWHYWWLKHNALRFWLQFLERFGSGWVTGRYPMHNDQARDAMSSVLKNLVNNSKVLQPVPAGAEDREQYGIEVHEMGGKGTTFELFQKFIDDWAGKHIRLMIAGQEEEQRDSGDGLGSGRSEAMQDVFRMYRDYDAGALEETITDQLVRRLQFFNYGELPFQVQFQFVKEQQDYEEEERRFKTASELGMPVVKGDAYEALGLAEPQDDDEVLELGQGGGMDDEAGGLGDLFGDGGEFFRGHEPRRMRGALQQRFARAVGDQKKSYEAKHAPPGGVTIGGTEFKGGEFIPAEKVEEATEEERKALEGKGDGKDGEGGKGKSKTSRADLSDAKRAEDGSLKMADGSDPPEHIQKLKIPPAWTDVKVNEDPDADLMATGTDKKGRRQSVYSESFQMRQAAKKFERIRSLQQQSDEIRDRIEQDAAEGSDDAAASRLIMQTGLRPGSTRDTKGEKKAYGATTLEGRHVEVQDDGSVVLNFTGKKGVDLSIPVKDQDLAADLIERKKSAGDDGRLFDTSDSALRDYVKEATGGQFKPKDFRTLKGTSVAIERVAEDDDCCKTMKAYKKAVRDVAKEVSGVLGNTPTVALQSYIDPTVFTKWRPANAA